MHTRLHHIDARGLASIAAVAIGASLTLLLVTTEQSAAHVVPASGFISYALVLCAGVLTYFRWRTISLTRPGDVTVRHAAWLATGLTMSAAHGMLEVSSLTRLPQGWSLVGQVAVTLTLCVVAAVVERIDVPADPALLCAVAIMVMVVAYCVPPESLPLESLTDVETTAANTAVAVVGLLFAWIVLHLRTVTLYVRRQIAGAAVLLTAGQCLANLESQRPVLLAGTMTAYVMGAMVLCTLAADQLRSALHEHHGEVAFLEHSLAEVRAAVLKERQLLHEVGATLAGITNASRVMAQGQTLPQHRRRRLEGMLTAELDRLERLMLVRVCGSPEDGGDRPMQLDEVVEPIVVSHQARGRDVRWAPARDSAFGDPDEVAEICNILLENAARHAPGAPVRLSVQAHDDEVVIACADGGAGVPPELRHRLFDVEAKGAHSEGQGLGLAIAQRLATARGGSVELVDGPGATFVARLPRKELADVAASIVA